MKERFYKMILFLVYLISLAAMLDFEISLIINLRMLIIVVIGSGLLTLITVSKDQNRNLRISRARINLIITGVATSFLGELYTLATVSDKYSQATFIARKII